jgi:hypothetical protein
MKDNISCEHLQDYLSSFSLIYQCDTVKNGALRFATPFTYPNGSYIDLFFKRKHGLFDTYILSDYGQTFNYLLDIGFNLWATKKRRQFVTDICYSLNVRYAQNMFEVEILDSELPSLSDFIVRLTQACIRIADLSFTQRLQTYGTFDAEVEEFIALSDLDYETEPIDLIGIYDKPVKVDFKVKGIRTSSLIQTWSPRNPNISHTTSNEIFRRWHDLNNYRTMYQFVTVVDETDSTYRPDDLAVLYEYSQVFSFPTEREPFRETISV